jgi:hypothetical protein
MFGINTADPPMCLNTEDHAQSKTHLGDLHASLTFNTIHSTNEKSKSLIPPLPFLANSSYAVL